MPSAIRSWKRPSAGTVTYCSTVWMKVSMTPLATWVGGRVKVRVGSRMENLGKTSGLKIGYLPAPWLITPPLFISEPVAGRVTTVPSGTAPATGTGLKPCWSRSSQLSPWLAARATNLVPSMTEPPPTASRKSICSSRTTLTARISVE